MTGAETSVRSVVRLAIPVVLSGITAMLSSAIDLAVISHYSEAGVTSVAAGGAIVDVAANVLGAGLVGFRILCNRAVGAGDDAEAATLTRVTAWASAVVALAVSAALIAGGHGLLTLTTGSAEAAGQAYGYLVLRAVTLVPLLLTGIITSAAAARRRTSLGLAAATTTAGLNLALDWVLVFGVGPAPRLGVLGDGISTLTATSAGLAVAYVLSRKWLPGLRATRPATARTSRTAGAIARLSWPPALSALLDYVVSLVLVALVARLGTAELAAVRVTLEVHNIVFTLLTGFSVAAMVTLGRLSGNGGLSAVAAARASTLRVLALAGLLLAALVFAASKPLSELFLGDLPSAGPAAAGIRWIALACPIAGLTLFWTARLRVAKGTRHEMAANLTAIVLVQLPLGVLGYAFDQIGFFFTGICGYWLCRCVLTVFFARRVEAPCPT